MCGRYACARSTRELQDFFGTLNRAEPQWLPSWNIAPTAPAPIIVPHGKARVLTLMRWGLIPSWATDMTLQPFNARAETVATNGTFRAAFRSRRCLVPADAYYEWARGKRPRQPWAFAKQDGKPLALAGIWDAWGWDGDVLNGFAVITTAASPAAHAIHNRMPVILEPRNFSRWLNGRPEEAGALMRPAQDTTLRFWPVSSRVDSVNANDPTLLDEIESDRSTVE